MNHIALNRHSGGIAGEIDYFLPTLLPPGLVPAVITGTAGIPIRPVTFACAPDGFYFGDETTSDLGRDIYFVAFADLTTAQKIYTHSTWVGPVRIRNDPTSTKGYRVFFAAFQQPNSYDVNKDIYYLKDDNTAALYYTVDASKLLLPDPCSGGADEAVYLRWDGSFCFDDTGGYLYVSTGGNMPGGIWKVSGATPTGVTGPLRRIISSVESTFPDLYESLAFYGGSLYYTSAYTIVRLDFDSTGWAVTGQTVELEAASLIPPYLHGCEDVGISTSAGAHHYVKAHTAPGALGAKQPVYYGPISKVVGKSIGPPTPHPHPDRVAQAQDWAIELLRKRGVKASVTALTQWSLRYTKIGTVEQYSGTLVDQYGKWHGYTVEITKNGKIGLKRSRVG